MKRVATLEQEIGTALGSAWVIRCFEEVESTMTQAREVAAQLDNGQSALVLSKIQSKGRGRQGRSWESPGEGFFGTIVLTPKVKIESLPPFTLVVGLTLAKVIESAGGKTLLKWPNDLLSISRKKVAGILVEHSGGTETGALLIGVGVNLSAAPKSIPNSTSLREEVGGYCSVSELGINLCNTLSLALSKYEQSGFRAFRKEWEERSFSLGESISVHVGSALKSGEFQGVTDSGALVLSVHGRREEFVSGEIV